MPAPSPDQILANPPPLVPLNLQNWPYGALSFPASDIVAFGLTIGNPGAPAQPFPVSGDRIE